MRIRITDLAEQKLLHTLDAGTSGLKLLYDSEGCGMNGIARVIPVPRTAAAAGEGLAAETPFRIFFDTCQIYYPSFSV